MPTSVNGQMFSMGANDMVTRCDNCGEKLKREMATNGTIVRDRRRCVSCGIVYFRPQGEGGIILAGVETLRRLDVRTYEG